MTNIPNNPDLPGIAFEAEVEILVAETIEAAAPVSDDAAHAVDTIEIGYYEAELKSLRDAATSLNEAEQHLRWPRQRSDLGSRERFDGTARGCRVA